MLIKMKILLSFVFATFLVSGILVSCDSESDKDDPDPQAATTTVSSTTELHTTTVSSTTELHTTTVSSTTELPTTTTELPTTTVSSTTELPTTTVSSTELPTTVVPVTTEAPQPTPHEGSWNVTENNVTCIRAEMKAMFDIHIGGDTYYIALSPNATSDQSSCDFSNGTQALVLSESNKYNLTMIFKEESSKVFVNNITLWYNLVEGQGSVYNDKDKLFAVKPGNSYMCKSKINIALGNVTMEIFDVHIQAFAKKDDSNFGSAEECEADDKVSDAVPIAVGCALAALIIVVLIAYLVGRRQSRQKGYQSV